VVQDQKVTVWLGAADRPVVILTKQFSQSVTDLAWTPDGHTLLACSSDGSVAAVGVQSFPPSRCRGCLPTRLITPSPPLPGILCLCYDLPALGAAQGSHSWL
jgi:hypothetical protein